MKLVTEEYFSQISRLPKNGNHIVAQYDDSSIVVYQAYRPEIGHFAASFGYFGGEFSLNRMSWIKTSFLWMMYRSEWGTKPGQEIVLAIWLKRSAFDQILESVVHSSFIPELSKNEQEWKKAIKQSNVRLQWDPDHHPSGRKIERRAIQLGLRGDILARYAAEWIIGVEDISEFVQQQRQYKEDRELTKLLVPSASLYPVKQSDIAKKLNL